MLSIKHLAITATLLASGLFADDHAYSRMSSNTLSTPEAALYQKECGACHMAYQPAFLPKRSWELTMEQLSNHFGTDATLESADHQSIRTYLMNNASSNERITDINGNIALRISETPHFVREHRELSKKMITQPEVGSIANCTACHTNAQKGSYREREIRIPNYGRWE